MGRSRKVFLALLALTGLQTSAALAQDVDRGLRTVRDPAGEEVLEIGDSYALLIGASRYTAGWQPLPGVERDLVELERVFLAHGFDVRIVPDPNAEELRDAFEKFIRDYGRDETNRLLVYFAGHGHTITIHERPRGYLVPVDAPLPEDDINLFLDKALPLHTMGGLALDIRARHAIFFFDSCFSGSVFGDLDRAPPPPPASISYLTGKPVRQFVSSGSAGQKVPDRSEFRVQLVDALDGKTDLSSDEYVTGTELGNFLFRTVMDARGDQTPQYGALEDGVYDKGDFVFVIPPPPAQGSGAVGSVPTTASGEGTAAGGNAISTIAVLPPTLIDLGAEVRDGLGDAIVSALNEFAGSIMDPHLVSGVLTTANLQQIVDCEADDLCLLEVCDMLDVDLTVATVFEELSGPTYAVEVVVIDDAACNLVGRKTKSASQLTLLRGRAEKAARELVSGWQQ